jgi:lipopolysaccharide export LptBFGC system permease protein LptF
MKKIKSPWYGIAWIVIWTIALALLLKFGGFNQRESIGLVLVWAVLVGITVYMLVRHLQEAGKQQGIAPRPSPATPALNAPCPCGSGMKYKRCCGTRE